MCSVTPDTKALMLVTLTQKFLYSNPIVLQYVTLSESGEFYIDREILPKIKTRTDEDGMLRMRDPL